ncbi:MAG: MarR family transcriptional regulator [Candidatus Helarchaeota archaeon]|nr:MarR family transcriptional regulator [Candidatus Helarchaeota archaeon]
MDVEQELKNTTGWNKIYETKFQVKMEEDFIDIFEDLLEKQGFSRMHGRIMAIIYLKEVSMTQAELERRSNFSRSSINKAVNTLQKLGYIRKRQKGEGKTIEYYLEWGPEEIFLAGIRDYLDFFRQIHERFSKLFKKNPKLEGLPSKRLKEFIEHLPEVNNILNKAVEKIDEIELVLKK